MLKMPRFVSDKEDRMNRFHPHRDNMDQARNTKFLAVFWACLVTLYLLSFWP